MASNTSSNNESAGKHDPGRPVPDTAPAVDPDTLSPVKQHNPDNKGVNPSQRGPAQPSDLP
jgi:hypothetical protein